MSLAFLALMLTAGILLIIRGVQLSRGPKRRKRPDTDTCYVTVPTVPWSRGLHLPAPDWQVRDATEGRR